MNKPVGKELFVLNNKTKIMSDFRSLWCYYNKKIKYVNPPIKVLS